MSKQREVIVDSNVYIGDLSTQHTCEEFTPPSLERLKLSYKSGTGERNLTTPQFKSLDGEYKFKALPEAIYEEIAKLDEAIVTVKKAVMNGTDIQNHEHELTGGIDLSYGSCKNGEFLDVTIKQTGLVKYLYKIDGKVKVDINHADGISKIGGEDQMEKVRSILKG